MSILLIYLGQVLLITFNISLYLTADDFTRQCGTSVTEEVKHYFISPFSHVGLNDMSQFKTEIFFQNNFTAWAITFACLLQPDVFKGDMTRKILLFYLKEQ